MLHGRRRAVDLPNRDGVETHDRPPPTVLADPMPSHLRDFAPLPPSDGLQGMAVPMPPTSFYFDEGQGATPCDDEVDLLSAEPVVPGKNGPTARE